MHPVIQHIDIIKNIPSFCGLRIGDSEGYNLENDLCNHETGDIALNLFLTEHDVFVELEHGDNELISVINISFSICEPVTISDLQKLCNNLKFIFKYKSMSEKYSEDIDEDNPNESNVECDFTMRDDYYEITLGFSNCGMVEINISPVKDDLSIYRKMNELIA